MWLCNSCTFATRPIKVLFSYFKNFTRRSLSPFDFESKSHTVWLSGPVHRPQQQEASWTFCSLKWNWLTATSPCNSKRNRRFKSAFLGRGGIARLFRRVALLWSNFKEGQYIFVMGFNWRRPWRAKRNHVSETWWSKPRQMSWRARHISSSEARRPSLSASERAARPTCAILHTFAPCAVSFARALSYAMCLPHALRSPTVNTAEAE